MRTTLNRALERTPATKKFCDGARFDPVEVCYFD